MLLSSMGFLGLGMQPPAAEWGTMVRENMSGISLASMGVLAPAFAIFSVTLAINVLVDWNVRQSNRNIPDEMQL